MISRISAVVMAVLLVLYLVVVTQYAIVLLGSGDAVAVGIGAALIVLPLIGAWALVSELIFVSKAQRLVAKLRESGELPVDDLPRLPSGRIDAKAADLEFPEYKAAVEANPAAWQDWMRLGLAYDASADRRHARWATRRAIALERAETRAR